MTAKSKLKSATEAVVKALTPSEEGSENTDILDTLKKEHDDVKSLLSELQDAAAAAQRKALVKRIRAALVPHTKAEEKVVYDAVIALKEKDAQTDGHEGYLEHEWASKTLQRLEAIADATSPEHKAAGKVLKELVEHHIKEEESNVWSDVKDNFSDDDRARMNVAFLAAKQRVRV
jgi:hemerythrin superfamily protein